MKIFFSFLVACVLTLFLPMSVVEAWQKASLGRAVIPTRARPFALHMSTAIDTTDKKLPKVEGIKDRSNYLHTPLQEEMQNEEIFLGADAVVVLKYHGSYMQDNRDKRQRGVEKDYQFMLRLKVPGGELPSDVYLKLDELSEKFGQGDLRATTRQAWQLHGVLKSDLKTVISTIMEVGSSTVGACGDVNRNVMCPAAPFQRKDYEAARTYSKLFAELFKPQSTAFTNIWLKGENTHGGEVVENEKVVEIEHWVKDLYAQGVDVQEEVIKQKSRQASSSHATTNLDAVYTKDSVEPLYGKRYLPRKFKIGVTVPGDNSVDLYTNDLGLVVIMSPDGQEVQGFNVMVGGGMGRTHNKDSTFARVADHLGYVAKEDVVDLCYAILATQRDHGNREVRPNARMKYLVHEKGINDFRSLVESYFGKKLGDWKELPEWKFEDWLGWHEQGDGKLFLGVNIEQGRVRDYDATDFGTLQNVKMKSLVKKLVSQYHLTTVVTPSQSIIFKDIDPKDKADIDAIIKAHHVASAEAVDPLTRKSMACPALPLCGLAIAEAERRMPLWMQNMRQLMQRVGLTTADEIVLRMTGCPNGCARPYMAELALVGDGPESYQVWLGGEPNLTSLAWTYLNKVKWQDMDATIEPLLVYWKVNRKENESFGGFCNRIGSEELQRFTKSYQLQQSSLLTSTA